MSEKVLCLLSDYEGNGGVHRFNRNLVSALQANSLQCRVLTLNDENTTALYRGHGGNKWLYVLSAIKTVLQFKPDFLIIGLLNFAPLSLLKMLRPCRAVIILHGFEAWHRRTRLAPFYRWVDVFWAVSRYTKMTFSETNGVPERKVKKIFNTIPGSWDCPHPEYGRYFLSVTRLDKGERYKGIDKTIEAVSRLQDEMRLLGWEYRIVAGGNDMERHRQLAARHGLSDIVKFQSNLADEELKNLYAGCSFFNLPSSGEGFGIVFLEAMAYRKACIGADNCGTEDVIRHGETGFLIEPTVENIESCLRLLLSDPALCRSMGEAGHEKLQATFSFDRFCEKIGELLQVRKVRLPQVSENV